MKKPIIAFGIVTLMASTGYCQLNLNNSINKISKEIKSNKKGDGKTALSN